jgi:hypothetical protein
VCPACGATGPERHLWIYLATLGILDEALPRSILHLGPAGARFTSQLRALGPARHVVLEEAGIPGAASSDAIDPDAIVCGDGEFHLVICDHWLERAVDLPRAIGELSRCVAADGWLVVQAAFSPKLLRTLEFTQPPTAAAARLFFGEGARRRLFGADLLPMLRAAGLQGRLYSHEEALPGVDAEHWGCDPDEPLGLFSRTRWLESRS